MRKTLIVANNALFMAVVLAASARATEQTSRLDFDAGSHAFNWEESLSSVQSASYYQPDATSEEEDAEEDAPHQPVVQATQPVADAAFFTETYEYHYMGRFWARADYLYWWVQGYAVPPLATLSPSPPGPLTGSLLDPAAAVVLGDGRLNGDGRSGYRVRFGYWFDDHQQWGIEAEFFNLESGGTSSTVVPGGGNLLYRPFFNANPAVNRQDAERADRISVGSSTSVYSPAVALRHNLCCCFDRCNARGYFLDAIVGYRNFHLGDTLAVSETATFGPTTFNLVDVFDTANDFHGAEIGLIGQLYRGPWLLEGFAKIALGNNHESVRINGRGNFQTPPGPAFPTPGGFYAQPTNIGNYDSDRFAVIPQFGLSASRLITDNLNFTFGYTFMWISHAVRPGDQMDYAIDGRWLDPNFVPPGTPPATRPAASLVGSSYWVQGINLGLEWKY